MGRNQGKPAGGRGRAVGASMVIQRGSREGGGSQPTHHPPAPTESNFGLNVFNFLKLEEYFLVLYSFCGKILFYFFNFLKSDTFFVDGSPALLSVIWAPAIIRRIFFNLEKRFQNPSDKREG